MLLAATQTAATETSGTMKGTAIGSTRRAILLRFPFWTSLLLLGLLLGRPATAAIILANQLERKIEVTLKIGDAEPTTRELDSQEVYPIHETADVVLGFTADGKPQAHKLTNYALYYIAKNENGVGLFVFGMPGPAEGPPRGKPGEPAIGPDETLVIPVKIFVDDEQPAQERVWRADLERCVEAASNVYKQAANVEFKVVAAGRWDSDDSITDFSKASAEFRRKAKPRPGLIAIGFSSQYRRLRGRVHFGSIAGPFCSHILLRDWKQHMTKNERHELLAHELGHYFGATHSIDPASIMRPVIMGNRPPNSLGYHPLALRRDQHAPDQPVRRGNARATAPAPQPAVHAPPPQLCGDSTCRERSKSATSTPTWRKCFPDDDAAKRLKEYIARSIPKPRKPKEEEADAGGTEDAGGTP